MVVSLLILNFIGLVFVWSKLHDVEQKLFRFHDETDLYLKDITEQVNINQDILHRIE